MPAAVRMLGVSRVHPFVYFNPMAQKNLHQSGNHQINPSHGAYLPLDDVRLHNAFPKYGPHGIDPLLPVIAPVIILLQEHAVQQAVERSDQIVDRLPAKQAERMPSSKILPSASSSSRSDKANCSRSLSCSGAGGNSRATFKKVTCS